MFVRKPVLTRDTKYKWSAGPVRGRERRRVRGRNAKRETRSGWWDFKEEIREAHRAAAGGAAMRC